jgi:7-carboxy-7-deazaguanine synthase
MKKYKYALAEEFHSFQGEGLYTGTQMKFIRLAYCNVGCPWCDTDYSPKYMRTAEQLLEDVYERHICVTGGEPLQQDLEELIYAAASKDILVHIETSGTIELPGYAPNWVYFCVSPKKGFRIDTVLTADEVKVVVAPPRIDEDLDFIWDIVKQQPIPGHKYIQPLNDVDTVNKEHLDYAMLVCRHNPTWRLSPQVQKLIGVR